MAKEYDIFISYRRDGGFDTANLLYTHLTNSGYSVFMDCENMGPGKFDEQLYRRIDNCKDVLVVLSENSLEKCNNEEDWLRLEVAHAILKGKNIIPVLLRNFKFPDALPEDIALLKTYQGVTVSQNFYNAFIVNLKKLLKSKKSITWNRVKKYVFFSIVPILIAVGVFIYLGTREKVIKEKEKKQYIQISKEVVSFMSAEYVKMNLTLVTIDDAFKEWENFRRKLFQYNPMNKEQLKKEFIDYINFSITKLDTIYPELKISDLYEKTFIANGVPTEDIKGFYLIHYNDEAIKYLNTLKYWVKSPESGWLTTLDEAVEVLTDFNKELIVGNIYPFIELINTMPTEARESFYKFQPLLTKFPDVGFNRKKEELESLQNKSIQRCNELLNKYAGLIGDESKIVDYLGFIYQLNLMQKQNPIYQEIQRRIQAKKDSINKKKELLEVKKIEVKEKTTQVNQIYKKLLDKCSFTADEEQGMMWGKILHLVTFGYEAIKNEKMYRDEYARLKKEASKDSAMVKESFAVVSSKQVFHDVQNLLDQYLKYNIKNDPASKQYVSAAKNYFKLIGERKLASEGVLMMGTQDNLPHPTFKVGDIIIERKGKKILNVDDFFNLKDDPSPNIVKIIRFSSSGKLSIFTEEVKSSKVLIGLMNLKEQN